MCYTSHAKIFSSNVGDKGIERTGVKNLSIKGISYMRKRIAFINQRYGAEVNGGSEYYTMLMAQKLSKKYEVEILTSKALTYDHWADYYMNDVEEINGIKVRRFGVRHKRMRIIQKMIEKMILWLHLNFVWLNKILIKVQGPYVPKLIQYMKENKENYDAFVFVTYLYYPIVFGMPEVREKAVFVPTAHDEVNIYFKIFKHLFHLPKAFVYLTEEEKNFVHECFGTSDIYCQVAGVGIDLPKEIRAERFREKYKIYGDYIIYAGRVARNKGVEEMLRYFGQYVKQNTGLSLVLIGKEYMHIPADKNIISLGFVPEQDKFDAIKGAKALWMPSQYESLSIAVLEAMALSVPVIVNGKSKVLKGHCCRSGGGVSYLGYKEFAEGMEYLFGRNYEIICRNAKIYVESGYRWDIIIDKWEDVLNHIWSKQRN